MKYSMEEELQLNKLQIYTVIIIIIIICYYYYYLLLFIINLK
jgi:hypothetical protein